MKRTGVPQEGLGPYRYCKALTDSASESSVTSDQKSLEVNLSISQKTDWVRGCWHTGSQVKRELQEASRNWRPKEENVVLEHGSGEVLEEVKGKWMIL